MNELHTDPAIDTPFRRQVRDAIVEIVASAGTELVAISTIYDIVEERFGPSLNRNPDRDRPSQQQWQHDVRWELKSALLNQRLVHRPDLGNGIYMLPEPEDVAARWDAVLTVGRDVPPGWEHLDHLFLPGRHRPLDLRPGSHVWIRQRRRLTHRALVTAVEHLDARPSALDGAELGAGYVARVEAWERVDLTDPEIGVAGRWGRVPLRYLDPVTLQLRDGTPAAPGIRWTSSPTRRTNNVISRPTATPTEWAMVEHHLQLDWIEWATALGRVIRTPVITTGEGTTLTPDAYDTTEHILVEAKGSSSREHVRLAIGQTLDYSHHIREKHQRAILVPDRPAPSIVAVATAAGIGFIMRDGSGFAEELITES